MPSVSFVSNAPGHIGRHMATQEVWGSESEELAHIGRWQLDLRSRESEWSPGIFRILGYEPDAVRPSLERLLEHLEPGDRGFVASLLKLALADRDLHPRGEVVAEVGLHRTDGEWRKVRLVSTFALGSESHWSGAVLDVTGWPAASAPHGALSQAARAGANHTGDGVALLRQLATAGGFELGGLLLVDNGRTRVEAFWHAPALRSARSVLERQLVRGSGSAVSRTAHELGLDSGFLFRAAPAGETSPVIALYGRHAVRADRPFLAGSEEVIARPRLSARESQILRLAADGLSGPAIADRLVLSPATVKSHFANLYAKLGVTDRAAAVAFALRHGLIS